MVSIYNLKPQFQKLLRPLMLRLVDAGMTANQVTVLGLLLSMGVGACIALFPAPRWPLLLIPVTLFVRMALNAIDGMMAREHNMKSRLGALLNELCDVASDAALFLPLAGVAGFCPWLVVSAVVLAGLTELAGLAAVQIGASRRYDGPMGKSDRAFVFGLLTLLVGCNVQTGAWLDGVLGLINLLLLITIVNRCRKALAEVPASTNPTSD